MSRIVIALCISTLLMASSPALAGMGRSEPGVVSKVFDVAVVRPVSLGISAATTGVFFGLLPFTYLTGISKQSAYALVNAPWRFTSARYVGDYSHYRDGRSMSGKVKAPHRR